MDTHNWTLLISKVNELAIDRKSMCFVCDEVWYWKLEQTGQYSHMQCIHETSTQKRRLKVPYNEYLTSWILRWVTWSNQRLVLQMMEMSDNIPAANPWRLGRLVMMLTTALAKGQWLRPGCRHHAVLHWHGPCGTLRRRNRLLRAPSIPPLPPLYAPHLVSLQKNLTPYVPFTQAFLPSAIIPQDAQALWYIVI